MKTRLKILIGLFIVFLILTLILTVQNCEKETQTKNPLNKEMSPQLDVMESDGSVLAESFPVNTEGVMYYLGYVNDSIIYAQKEDGEDNKDVVSFWIKKRGEKPQLIEKRAGYLVSRGYAFYRSPNVYFSLLAESDNPEWKYGENVFLQYDMEKKECKEYKGVFPTFISACYFWEEDELFYQSEDYNDKNEEISYLGVFDLNGKEEKRYREYNFPIEKKEWLAASADRNEVKGLYMDMSDSTGINMDYSVYLLVFDRDFREINTYQLSDDLRNYLLELGFVTYMVSYNEYVYINNNYNQNCLIKLEDGDVKELFRGNDFRICRAMDGSSPLFYYEGTNRVFRINEKGDIEEVDLAICNGGVIKAMFADKDSCYAECICGDKKFAYTFLREDLTKINLPCE